MGSLSLIVVLAAMTVTGWCGPVNAFNPFRRHALLGQDGLALVCRDPDLPQELLDNLIRLKLSITDDMDSSEEQLASYVHSATGFSQQQTMSSLTEDLHHIHQNLTCMGKALDILCLPRYRSCSHHDHTRLYRHHALPRNARTLRSSRTFRTQYHDVMDILVELRARLSADDSNEVGSLAPDHGCERWSNNAALVMSLGVVHVRAAQSLLEHVVRACGDL